jgi:hypothetical protein
VRAEGVAGFLCSCDRRVSPGARGGALYEHLLQEDAYEQIAPGP